MHAGIEHRLSGFHRSNRIPNLLFHGAHGSGKRTLVYNFVNLIYHDDHKDTLRAKIKTNVMFVNCAHGKGIKFIREELKFFAKTNIKGTDVKFKTIVLFNADCLTIDAQSALRRCIELFSFNTRFFIVVENKHRLLNPIVSRFCEIYVPENDGPIKNLHRARLQGIYQSSSSSSSSWWSTQVLNHDTLLSTVHAAYEHGQSALDFIDWVRATHPKRVDIVMHYHKIKSEYRCEKLLLFCLLSSFLG